jgi:hypothetical protein
LDKDADDSRTTASLVEFTESRAGAGESSAVTRNSVAWIILASDDAHFPLNEEYRDSVSDKGRWSTAMSRSEDDSEFPVRVCMRPDIPSGDCMVQCTTLIGESADSLFKAEAMSSDMETRILVVSRSGDSAAAPDFLMHCRVALVVVASAFLLSDASMNLPAVTDCNTFGRLRLGQT